MTNSDNHERKHISMTVMTPTAEEFIREKRQRFEKERGKKELKFKDISRKGYRVWKREAWTFMPQSDYPEKVFVIERLRYSHDEDKGGLKPWASDYDRCQYRIGYFIVGKIGRQRGKWTWAQFCPLIPSRDIRELIKRAEDEETIQ